MKVESLGYNIPEVTTGKTLVAGQSTAVGSVEQLNELRDMIQNCGLARVITPIMLNDAIWGFNGVVTCNLCQNGFEFHTITYASDEVTGGSPIIVGGQFYNDNGTVKCHITAVVVS